jgi:hypothetical protein
VLLSISSAIGYRPVTLVQLCHLWNVRATPPPKGGAASIAR